MSSFPILLAPAGPRTRILLLHAPYPGRLKFDGQPGSLLYAAAPLVQSLAERGRLEEVGILDPREASEGFYDHLQRILEGGEVRVVCISASTAAVEEAARVASLVRAASEASLVIAGGPHEDSCPISMAEGVRAVDLSIAGAASVALSRLALEYLDAEVSREGFLRDLPKVLRGLRPDGRATVSVAGRSWTLEGKPPAEVDWLLRRPWTTRAIHFAVFPGRPTLPLMLSRGCSYGQCTFCAESLIGGQRVVGDFSGLVDLMERHPGAALYFQDSIFPSGRAVRSELLPMLGSSGRHWGCQVYLPTLSKAFVRLLAAHGCQYVYTGIESASEDIRAAGGKGGYSDSLLRERLSWIAEAKMSVGISLMFGALSESGKLLETAETVEGTRRLAEQLVEEGVPVAGYYPNVLTLLPGTRLADGCSRAVGGIDFYRMPRASEFGALEDGSVGYNFLTLRLGPADERARVAEAIREAAPALVDLGQHRW